AKVVTAVANGDLNQKLSVDAKGEVAALAETINIMTDTLSIFAEQVTTVAREVGTEGILGGQAKVPNVAGTWKDLTDNVNFMASNLTTQVRGIAKVVTAVADGDLDQKLVVEAKGEVAALAETINSMTGTLSIFAEQVTTVAREVGTEGKLGGQADVPNAAGTWKDLTDNVNFMASNLTGQVRNIALVTTAVANGDLSQKITADVKGEMLELKNTINVMVDQLSSFAAEVTRVAKEVGTEGKLGGQAEVEGVSGTWKDLTDNVNGLAGNLTNQVRNIALVTTAVANGDLSKKITVDVKGEMLELKNTVNLMVDQLNSFAAEVTRVAREVGTEGKLGGQAEVEGVSGTWKDLTDSVNFMAGNLTTQVRGIVKVVTAVADGDLTQKLTVEAKGEVAALAETINDMTDTLSIFAEQVTSVAREVGTEGILGGQAKVPNVAGTWKDLTENVNFMASNLTTQVRGIAKVVTAVANGDLNQKLSVDAKGEVAALAETINNMTDTLSIFAEQVITVAREVGAEGKLGGQAKVPNVAGTWKDLTDNVNFMANSLTTQVRAISDVATAVTEGDLTRSIDVEAQGEVDTLRNNINQMIANLKETTQKNQDQDFLKTNLARFSRMMQGQKSLESVADLIMSEVTPLVKANHGVFFINEGTGRESMLQLISSYAYQERKGVPNRFALGQGIVGQCALEKKPILMEEVPADYIRISSGLGASTPLNVIALPVLFEGEIMAVIELASFQEFSEIHRTFLTQMTESIGVVLNMIQANVRTEELLEKSQSLTQDLQSQSQELQSQQDQLRRSNSELEAQAKELEEKASLLAVQNTRVEQKNREVELARAALEEKAEQLALSSKYKSEFLANMSHELRTPLNSMLILAKLLADNSEGNLTAKQVGFAQTVHGAGGDLLNLINEILDLSKVEAGKMEIEITDVPLLDVRDYVKRSFSQQAEQKGIDFRVTIAPEVPYTMQTDSGRLHQVLKNLLSNAFKFTEAGSVELDISLADPLAARLPHYNGGPILAFSVRDTGIGIPRDKQNLIFEAFQQADGTTSRKYGGTGLGLSISKGISGLLGGRIQVQSEPGEGSTFTLFLPQEFLGNSDNDPSFDSEFPYSTGNGFDGSSGYGNGGSGNGSYRTAAYGNGGYTGGSYGAGNGNATRAQEGVGMRRSQPATFTAEATHVAPRYTDTQATRTYLTDASASTPAARTVGTSGNTSAPAANLKAQALAAQRTSTSTTPAFNDDRHNIEPGDRVLLIIEDDVNFATILLDTGRRQGFKGIVALQGDTALAMAREYQPHAITLDLQLPLIDGWTVLDHLKRDPETRHIPVQVISVIDRNRGSMVKAISYLEKPVSREAIEGALAHMKSFGERDVRELLVVEDDEAQRLSIAQLIDGLDVNITHAANGEEAQTQLKEKSFDCMILDLGLPDMAGFELLKKIKKQARYKDLPVVIYTGQDLSKQEEGQLKKYAATIITKNATSSERLVDETALFLHRVFKTTQSVVEDTPFTMPAPAGSTTSTDAGKEAVQNASSNDGAASTEDAKPKRRRAGAQNGTNDGTVEHSVDGSANGSADGALDGLSMDGTATNKFSNGSGTSNSPLEGLKVLVVDDDSRNIFALTSVLENYGITVVYADNGRSGIEVLQATPNVDLILMDVMMPEMDGYETTQTIRSLDGYKELPIIALTAKAMAGDREKCLEAGASDYITKPVDIEALLTLMRQWSQR
ncbi:MAG: hypothetical protein JWN98_1857, partial [Abditibacteriota bacterium]|nr:hypothetical protein [Abditibacteriota bacterium]